MDISESNWSSNAVSTNASHKLDYEVVGFSGFSANYTPDQIMIDNPNDQTSRWSSDSNNPTQYITVRLKRPAIVKSVKFGKYQKTHVCNLKRLKIFGGITEQSMIELIESSLKNDSIPEVLPLRHKIVQHHLPCRFLKIVPLQSWGPTFNFSIWYVEFIGDDDSEFVQSSMNAFNQHRETEGMRLCLKFLRDRHHQDLCRELETRTGVALEHRIVTELYRELVTSEDLPAAESVLIQACREGFFDNHVQQQCYSAEWTKLSIDCDSMLVPGMRGGHQMVVDSLDSRIYLFGGWDGRSDLADFWSYNIARGEWIRLSENTETDGGPGPRSCHRMVLDSISRQIFILGKYVEPMCRTANRLVSDFYAYHIPSGTWHLISEDTVLDGGPSLLYEHQLAIDVDKHAIYCFGGRILMASGLFAYHIDTNTWALLRNDNCAGLMRARTGHSMLFCPLTRRLFIFGGQRGKVTLSDFLVYDVDQDQATVVLDERSNVFDGNVDSGIGSAQRATLDWDLQELYVLSGSTGRTKSADDACLKNTLWVYRLDEKKWMCIFDHEQHSQEVHSTSRDSVPTREQVLNVLRLRRQQKEQQKEQQQMQPCPRYAHQFVYDPSSKSHFLFGGNPGRPSSSARLNDFWRLKLSKPTTEDILRECQWKIRKCILNDLVQKDSLKAIEYLQNNFEQIIDHNDPKRTYRKLAGRLFCESKFLFRENVHERNERLFNKLIRFFPLIMRPPLNNLVDLLTV